MVRVGLRVWPRREFFSKKINKKKTGSIQPPPIKTKVNRLDPFPGYFSWVGFVSGSRLFGVSDPYPGEPPPGSATLPPSQR